MIPHGGTLLFALLALGGDVGCSSGPAFVGMISAAFEGNLYRGILAATVFPVLMLLGVLLIRKKTLT